MIKRSTTSSTTGKMKIFLLFFRRSNHTSVLDVNEPIKKARMNPKQLKLIFTTYEHSNELRGKRSFELSFRNVAARHIGD